MAFPTETVYGLGADATSPEALERLYRTKGRPANHPVIVHLGESEWLSSWAELSETARLLAETFWPGPLTMVLPRKAGVSDLITGGQDTVAVRMPDHPLALVLLKMFGRALVAPSANRFGRVSPTTAEHVMSEFTPEEVRVLDGGPCLVGVESTIVDLSGPIPVVLRPGGITTTEIFEALGLEPGSGESSARAPGGLSTHYAPTTRTLLVDPLSLSGQGREWQSRKLSVGALTRENHEGFTVWVEAPEEPEAYARLLYAALRHLDDSGVEVILIEIPPEGEKWAAVHDRLQRASHHD